MRFTLQDCVDAAIAIQDAFAFSAVDLVRQAFSHASREPMLRSMRSAALHRPDLTGVVQGIRTPTLLLDGDADVMATRSVNQAVAQRVTAIDTATVDGAGHLPPLEAPTPFAATVMGFWARVGDSPRA